MSLLVQVFRAEAGFLEVLEMDQPQAETETFPFSVGTDKRDHQ